jgi:putative acetyltransferase
MRLQGFVDLLKQRLNLKLRGFAIESEMHESETEFSYSFFKIRLMRREEIYDVLNLIHFSIRELNSKDYSPQQIETILRMYDKPFLKRGVVIVAEKDSQIIGAAKATPFRFAGFKSIQAVFTHPHFIRMGVGKALVHEIERQANIGNIKQLSVTSSLTAVDFYMSLGYKKLGPINASGGIPSYFLEKQLKPFTFGDKAITILFLISILGFPIIVAAILLFRAIR